MKYNYLLLLKAFKQKFNYSNDIFFFKNNDIKLFFFLLKKFFFIIKNIEKLPNFTYKNYIFFKNSLDFKFLNFFKFFLEKEKKNHIMIKSFDFFDETKDFKIIDRGDIKKNFWIKDKMKKKYKKYNYSLNKFKVLKSSTKFNEYWNTDCIKDGYDALWNKFQYFNQDTMWGTPVIKDKLLLYRSKMNDSDGMGNFELFARQRLNKYLINNKKKKNLPAKVLRKNLWLIKKKNTLKKKIKKSPRKITYEEVMRYNKRKKELDAMKAIEIIENEKRRLGMEKAKIKEGRWEIVKNDVFMQVMNRRFSLKRDFINLHSSKNYFKKIYEELLTDKNNDLKNNLNIKDINIKKIPKNIKKLIIENKNLKKKLSKKNLNKKDLTRKDLTRKDSFKIFKTNKKIIKKELLLKKKLKVNGNFFLFYKYLLTFNYKNFIFKRFMQILNKKFLKYLKKKDRKKILKHSTVFSSRFKKLKKINKNKYFLFYYNLKKLLPKFNKIFLRFKKKKNLFIKNIKTINPWLRLRWWRFKKNKTLTKNKSFRLLKKAKFRRLVKKFERFRWTKLIINSLKISELKYIKLKYKYKKNKKKNKKIERSRLKLLNVSTLIKIKNYKKNKKRYLKDINDVKVFKNKNLIFFFKNFNIKKKKLKKKFNFQIYNLFLRDKFNFYIEENINKNLYFKNKLKAMGYKPYFIDFKKNLDMKFHIINIYNIIKRGSLINGGQFIFTTHNIIENMNLFYQYQYEKWILKLLFMKNTYFRWFSTYISNTPFMSFGAKYFFDQQKLALVNIVKPTLLDLEKFKSLLNMNRDKKNFNANKSMNIIVHNYFYKILYSNYSIILTRFSFKSTGKVISNYLMQLVKTVRFEAIRPDFIIEFINVCALTFFSKDPKPLVKWIIKVINKISHKKHWKFLFLLKVNILKLAFKFIKETNFAGFHLRVRGKIGALGCVRKKIVHIKMGEYGFSKYYLKGDIYYLSAVTITGKIGVKMIVCYK